MRLPLETTHPYTGTKPDEYGNVYAFFSPRGFANEGTTYLVRRDQIQKAVALGEQAARFNEGYLEFIDAAQALRDTDGSPAELEDHPWFRHD